MCRPLCDGLPGTCRAGAPPGCPGGVREWGAATQTPSQLQDWRTHCPPCLPGFSPQSVLETATPPPGQTRTKGLTPPTAASLSAKCPFPFKEETGTKSFQSPQSLDLNPGSSPTGEQSLGAGSPLQGPGLCSFQAMCWGPWGQAASGPQAAAALSPIHQAAGSSRQAGGDESGALPTQDFAQAQSPQAPPPPAHQWLRQDVTLAVGCPGPACPLMDLEAMGPGLVLAGTPDLQEGHCGPARGRW